MIQKKDNVIWVYADWDTLKGPRLMGTLYTQRVRGKEVFSFEYKEEWMNTVDNALYLDPDLGHFKGKQFLPEAKINFGIFLDSSPDRWGKLLMRRREAWLAQTEKREESVLLESDYLLGVHDQSRMGALRFKLHPEGVFMNHDTRMSTPPWTSLRELEHASLQLEREDAIHDPEYAKWLNMLIDPGSSLGGARPKASVLDEKGNLWIAKFPSSKDEKDSGAWEMVLHELAKSCGIAVPQARLMRFSNKHHTFLSKRFDRTANRKRLHFSSAMTLLGRSDGTDFLDGVGYLDLVEFILRHCPSTTEDLEELWRRLVFNLLVSNTDDHLRNHGFILTNDGWRLSPAFDLNPNEFGNGLTLNITENSNEQDVSLALETARYYKLTKQQAEKHLTLIREKIGQWRSTAKKLGISSSEIEATKRAFRLLENS
jgi:serine/threonine-protein kinase HipA